MFADLKRNIIHNPADPGLRVPLGALQVGDSVSLSLLVKSENVLGVELRIFGENLQQTYAMHAKDSLYSACLFLPNKAGVIWYYFVLHGLDFTYYYGASMDERSCFGELYHDQPPAFQLTVYEKDFATPAWFRKGIMYQIFPDRFAKGEETAIQAGLAYHQKLGQSFRYHKDWDEAVDYLPTAGESYYKPADVYGGTLNAIQQKLPYLKNLGITTLYLNPVFEAASNHRYDTADYLRIDPLLGSNDDFTALAAAADALGIRILLDGVFSHTGEDSVYFDRYGHYGGQGAYQNPDSPYRSWYEFLPDGSYRCWWGFQSLPEVEEHSPEWQNFLITGENSVVKTWLRRGASGFRLDVVDELPDDVVELLRKDVKEEKEDALLLGEVWEDATTKESYGLKRSYALGRGLDSVMNYPLQKALTDFAVGKIGARALAVFCCKQRMNYPPPLYHSLMNLLSSHDIARIRTVLSSRLDGNGLSREQQASFLISDSQNQRGAKLQRMLAALQYTLPGVPCIYYGDEHGMQGFGDPFNRAPFCEQEPATADWYAQLSKIRHSHDALQQGAAAFLAPRPDVFAVLRCILNGKNALHEPAANGCFLTVVNRGNLASSAVLDLFREDVGFTEEEHQELLHLSPKWAKCLSKEAEAAVEDGLLFLMIPPHSAEIWQIF